MTLPFVGKARDKDKDEGCNFGFIFGTSNYSGSIKINQSYSIAGNRNYYIPSSLTEATINDASQIGYGAFDACSMLTKLNINIAAKDAIGDKAFRGCVAPHYFSSVEIVENITGQGVINETNPKMTQSMVVTAEHKQQFSSADCDYVYISIFCD